MLTIFLSYILVFQNLFLLSSIINYITYEYREPVKENERKKNQNNSSHRLLWVESSLGFFFFLPDRKWNEFGVWSRVQW